MDIRDNPPKILRLKRHKDYYCDIIDELRSNNVALKTQDRYPLAIMAVNLVIVEEATKSIQKNGMTIVVQGDRNQVTKQNPAVAAMKDAQNILKALFKEFQMTPASRPKIAAGTGANGTGTSDTDGWEKLTTPKTPQHTSGANSSSHNPFGNKKAH